MKQILSLLPLVVVIMPCISGYITFKISWWILAMCTSSLINFSVAVVAVCVLLLVYRMIFG